MTNEQKISDALEMAKSAMSDGDHHNQWTIDQMVRIFAGDNYDQWVADIQNGEDGPETYGWDTGIPA